MLIFRMIDFQLCHYNSYSWDLVYFIYSSIKPEERRAHFDLFLETYHKSLLSTLEFYGHSEGAPTCDDVRAEVNRLDYFAYTVLAIVFPVVCADTSEAFDMDKISHESEYAKAYNPDIFKSDKFKDAVSEELRTYMDNGVI